ncbi:MAG TPA: glycerol-3-phosphate 1-O-acyltransferase PlsY [Pyrinomonadaceae bacterium]|nr:glycerol-3-phosphate 1-O-acyltransferase PlsY [Pyrinomonadaceae bacterium]
MRPVLVILLAYLLGSIPFGYLIVRAKEGGDIRETGSGGTGATNVSRRAGKAAGVLTLLLDAMKGATAVLFAMWAFGLLGDSSRTVTFFESSVSTQQTTAHEGLPLYWWVAASAIAVLAGHIFPAWLKFRGGKGVATAVGVFLVLAPAAVAVALVIFISIVFVTRYVSLGSIVAAVSIPLLIWLQHVFVRPLESPGALLAAASLSALLVIFAHRENIARLVQRRESKFT